MLRKLFGFGKPENDSGFAKTEALGENTIQNLQTKDNKERESVPTHRIAIDSVATQRKHELEQLEEKMRGLDENSPEAKKLASEIRLVKIHLAGLQEEGLLPLTSKSSAKEIHATLEYIRLNPPQPGTQAEERAKATIAILEEEVERRITAASQIFTHHNFHEGTPEAQMMKIKAEIKRQEMYLEYRSSKANKDTLKKWQDERETILGAKYNVKSMDSKPNPGWFGMDKNGNERFVD